RARARGDGARQLADLDGWHAVILIDDREPEVLDVAAERIAEHDELRQREDHRHDDQHRTAAETPQLALDDGPGSVHGYPRRIMNGLSAADGACSASRSARPV